MYWLHGVAAANPFRTTHFLWLDVGRCPHLVDPPLNLSFLLPAARRDKFVIFAAYDTVTQCFGSLSRRRRARERRAAAMRAEAGQPPPSPPPPAAAMRAEAGGGGDGGSGAYAAREILRAQLMGGSARAIARVARLYDEILMEWMRRGEVFDKEEPILIFAWDMVRRAPSRGIWCG